MTRIFSVNLLALSEPFEQWCSARGQSPSASLRELVANALQTTAVRRPLPPTGPCNTQMETMEARSCCAPRSHQFTVRLTDGEIKHLRSRAAAARVPAARYLVAVLRGAETVGVLIVDKGIVAALMESNQRLARIGRCLTDAVRLKSWQSGAGAVSEDAAVRHGLEQLRRHVECAAAALAQVEQTRAGRSTGIRPRWRGRRTHEAGPD
jgi:hypothetical protein